MTKKEQKPKAPAITPIDTAIEQLRKSIEDANQNERTQFFEKQIEELQAKLAHLDKRISAAFDTLNLRLSQFEDGINDRVDALINKKANKAKTMIRAISEVTNEKITAYIDSFKEHIDAVLSAKTKQYDSLFEEIKNNHKLTENRWMVVVEEKNNVNQIALEQKALKMDYISRIDSLLNIVNDFIDQNKGK